MRGRVFDFCKYYFLIPIFCDRLDGMVVVEPPPLQYWAISGIFFLEA
jgi:hypothetical protein